MKIEKINLVRIMLVLPCIIFKLPLNELIGIDGCLNGVSFSQRLIFEIVTLCGLIYIVGFFEYNILKYAFPSLFRALKEKTDNLVGKV